VPSPEGNSLLFLTSLPGIAVPGFHITSLRDWGMGEKVES